VKDNSSNEVLKLNGGTYSFPQSSRNSLFSYVFYTILYNCILMLDQISSLQFYCIFIVGSVFSLMMAICSRNMPLVCTQIKLCVDCDFASFLFSLYKQRMGCCFLSCVIYRAIFMWRRRAIVVRLGQSRTLSPEYKKVKCTLELATKDHRGSRSIAVLFL
jgi:hypothetical protein